MKTPTESYQRQCDWSEGWDAAEATIEKRLDKMAEEFEDLLKDARDSDNRAARTIEQISTENEILRFEIDQLNRELLARSAERDFAERQLDRIRRALA